MKTKKQITRQSAGSLLLLAMEAIREREQPKNFSLTHKERLKQIELSKLKI